MEDILPLKPDVEGFGLPCTERDGFDDGGSNDSSLESVNSYFAKRSDGNLADTGLMSLLFPFEGSPSHWINGVLVSCFKVTSCISGEISRLVLTIIEPNLELVPVLTR